MLRKLKRFTKEEALPLPQMEKSLKKTIEVVSMTKGNNTSSEEEESHKSASTSLPSPMASQEQGIPPKRR